MKPWLKILIGLFLGIIAGITLMRFKVDTQLLSRLGEVFISLLKMVVGLIVFCSVVLGICHISDPKKLGRIGLRAILFYIVTTLIAISFGLTMVSTLKPGNYVQLLPPNGHSDTPSTTLTDFIFSIVPSNPFASFASGNILQIIVFAILFALAINMTGNKGKVVLGYIESLSEVMSNLTHVVMKLAPYGVFALIATAISKVGWSGAISLFWATLCILLACLIQIIIVFTLTLRYLAKVQVIPFFKGMKDAIVVAFTTSSSSATLPISLDCARNHLGISGDISGFVLSLGSTINMNGTAVGQTVLSIFLAQAYGIEITFTTLVILICTTLVSAIGTAGVPGSGLVMLSIVLSAIGIPLEGVVFIAGIDRIRDMLATVVNILGDAVAAVYIAKKENQIDEKVYHSATWLE